VKDSPPSAILDPSLLYRPFVDEQTDNVDLTVGAGRHQRSLIQVVAHVQELRVVDDGALYGR